MKTLKKAIETYKRDSKISEGEWRRMCNFNRNNFNKERLLAQIIVARYGIPDDCRNLNETDMAKKLAKEILSPHAHRSQMCK